MQLVQSLWVDKPPNTDDNVVTLQSKDGFSFTGTVVVGVGYDSPLLLRAPDNMYAVYMDSDVWVTPTRYKYVIIQLDPKFVSNIFTVLDDAETAEELADTLTTFYKELQVLFTKDCVKNSSRPAGPDTSKFSASISGAIKVVNNNMNYGGYYGTNTFCITAIQVGSGIDSTVSTLIRAVAQLATVYTSQRVSAYSSFTTNGTNFSTVALSK